MKRIVLYTALVLALLFPVAALAASYSSPAELLSSLTGVSVQELIEKHQQDETYGQIAEEYGVLDQYKAGQLEIKKQIIDERVQSGRITQEQGEQIKKAIEERIANCDGSGTRMGNGAGKGMGGMGRGARGAGMANGACLEL